jgi:hypothetical protein
LSHTKGEQHVPLFYFGKNCLKEAGKLEKRARNNEERAGQNEGKPRDKAFTDKERKKKEADHHTRGGF